MGELAFIALRSPAMSLYFEHEFDAVIEEYDVGSERYRYTVVFCPNSVAAVLPLKEHPRLRIHGEVGEQPFNAALNPAKGRWYLLLSKRTLRALSAGIGDSVNVRFSVADQDAVDVPPSLAERLAVNAELTRLWEEQTPGMQRGLAYRVASAKRQATQARRVDEVIDILEGKRSLRTAPARPGRRVRRPDRSDD